MSDLIRRADAIEIISKMFNFSGDKNIAKVWQQIKDLPSVESEDSIPIAWIEKEIDWLNSTDNYFLKLTTTNISAMVKKWKEEKDW